MSFRVMCGDRLLETSGCDHEENVASPFAAFAPADLE